MRAPSGNTRAAEAECATAAGALEKPTKTELPALRCFVAAAHWANYWDRRPRSAPSGVLSPWRYQSGERRVDRGGFWQSVTASRTTGRSEQIVSQALAGVGNTVPGPQCLAHGAGIGRKQEPQRKRHTQHPLSHRRCRQHLVDQQRSALHHAPRAAARAEAAAAKDDASKRSRTPFSTANSLRIRAVGVDEHVHVSGARRLDERANRVQSRRAQGRTMG
jgi:hypothetical protein